ncbi:MAG: hypothetical protein K6U12_00605 [Armatimonadetes bacterium]|nr:hypothetical protein [Armatimonadota bacterium]CUU34094.1 hypothetical protein DCOP10_10477 [Armatimonadetes bacterium DC]
MKRLGMIALAGAALTAWASAQSVWVRPYVWHDDASSDFTWSFANGCLTLSDTSTDCQGPTGPDWYSQCGWGNRHVWFVSMDGIGPTWFDPDSDGSSLEVEVTFNLTPVMQANRTVESGLFVLERPFPRYPREVNDQGNWWADGVFMVANESAGGAGGEIACFGGRLPFWNGGGVRYQGGPITLIFRYNGSTKKVQYEVRYGSTTATSPWLDPGDSGSTYNGGPHGLRYFSIGGYLQINGINGGNTAGGTAQWCTIKVNGKQILGPNSGDVDMNGCVDDADLLKVLFNFGTGCGN